MKHEGLHGSGAPFRRPILAEVKERANNYIKGMEAGSVIKNSLRVVEAVALTAAGAGVTFDVGKSLAEHGDVSHARTVQLVNELSATIKAYVSGREIRIPAIGGSEMILTPAPRFGTQTETATKTPTPEATATPTETPTPEEFKDAQAFLGDGFEVRPDGTVFDKTKNQEIPGLTIVPFNKDTMIKTGGPSDPEPTWAWQRVYEFKDKKDFTVNGTAYDLQTLPNSGLDMYAWTYENGEFTREKVAFPTKTSKTVDMDAYSPSEVEYMIITDSSSNPDHRVPCSLESVLKVMLRAILACVEYWQYKPYSRWIM